MFTRRRFLATTAATAATFAHASRAFAAQRPKYDLIIRGGLNISPKQIEDKLMEMGSIAEIACVGVPHAIYGEEVAVVVKLKPDFKAKVHAFQGGWAG